MEVEVLRNPEVEIPILTTACEGDYIELKPENLFSYGNLYYAWVFPWEDTMQLDYLEIISISMDQSGPYQLISKDTTGCNSSKSFENTGK